VLIVEFEESAAYQGTGGIRSFALRASLGFADSIGIIVELDADNIYFINEGLIFS
jgi:hypothetical protein